MRKIVFTAMLFAATSMFAQKTRNLSIEVLGAQSTVGINYDIPFDNNGDINGGVKVKNVRPYLGLGFGRLIPKKRVGFRFELGAQFQGKPKVYYMDNGNEIDALDKYKDNIDDGTKDDISKVMDWLRVYPVLKFSIRGRIL